MVAIAVIQQRLCSDWQKNLEETAVAVAEVAAKGAELVVLSELHTRPYFCQSEDINKFAWAEPIPGPTFHYLSALAKKHHVVLVGSIFEKRAVGIYHNTALVFEKNGELAGKYRKMHIPDDPNYYEKYYFTPGDLGFTPIATSVGKLGVLVCWDQWFPEAARIMALRGADLLIYPTAIGWFVHEDETQKEALIDSWITVQRGHSIANCLPVISCNRTGFEADPVHEGKGIHFWGNSFITNSHGQLLEHAATTEPAALVAKIDLKEIEMTRHIWPYFRDRRTDAYGDILKKYADFGDKNL